MATAPKPAKADAAAPRATTSWTLYAPTPLQTESDQLAAMQAAGEALPRLPWFHLWDNSPIDSQSYSETIGPVTWP